jgi:MFS family permease
MGTSETGSAGKKKLTLIGIYVGVVGSIIISGGFSTLLPVAALEIGGKEIYPLAATLMGIVNVIAMPLYGFLAMRSPAIKKKLFGLSMISGIAALLFRAFAGNMWMIVIPGVLYGFVSPGIFVIGFSLIREMYDTKQAGLYLGMVGTMMSVGMLVGPALTGVIIDTLGWRVVCHAAWPILLLSLILVSTGYRMNDDAAASVVWKGKFDFIGVTMLVLFFAPLTLVLSLGASYIPFGTPLNTGLFVLSIAGLLGLILVIRKKGNAAIIPAPVLKDRNVLCLTICNLAFSFSQMAVFFFMPTYVLYVIGGTAMQASLTTTMLAVCGLFLSPVFGKMIAKAVNARNVLIGGTVVRIVVTAALLFILKADTSIWIVYGLMLVGGIYNSQHSVTMAAAPQIQIKPELRVLGNSIIQVMQSLGANIGVAVFTLVIGSYGVASGMHFAFIIAIATAFIGLLAGLPLKKLEADPAQ